MKKIIHLLLVLFVAVTASSCMKDNPYEYYDVRAILEREAPIIEKYVKADAELSSGAVLDSASGIWYKIINEGVQPERDSEGKLIKTDYYEYNFNSMNYLEVPRVSYSYVGKMLSGKEFDRNSTKDDPDDKLPPAASDMLISGFNITFLPKMAITKTGEMREVGGLTTYGLQKGSKIRVVFPSPYGYQDKGKGEIPPDTPLDFTIEVFKVIPPAPPAY